jgi:hypothetical protein
VINLETRAFSIFTNLAFRGYTETPADTGKQNLYIVNDNTKAIICQGFDLFDVDDNDSILCDLGASAGVYRYGETSLGTGTAFAGLADTKYFSKIVVPTRAAISKIAVYSVGQGGGAGACNVRAGIYSDVAGVPTTLLGSTAVVALNQADGPAFRDYSFATPVELAPGSYWIGVQVETGGRVSFYHGATADGVNNPQDAYSDGLATPWVENHLSNGTFEVDLTGWGSSGSTITRDVTQFHSGIASMKTVASVNAPTFSGVFFTNLQAGTPMPQRTYTIGAWVKATGTAIGKLWTQQLNALGGAAGEAGIANSSVTLTGAWQFITSTGIVDQADRTSLTLYGVLDSITGAIGDTVYIDDVTVTVTDTTGPLIAYAQVLSCGPDFYVESKKFTEGDSMHKKLFKQLSITYISQGDSLRIDTVPGLQSIGRTATAAYPTTVYTWDQLVVLTGTWDNLTSLFPTWETLVLANFKPKRIKFLKRSQMLSFRLWQNSPSVTKAHLGPFQIAYKWQRLGRI